MKKAFLLATLFLLTMPGFGQRQKDTSAEAPTPKQKTTKPTAKAPEASSSKSTIAGGTSLEAMLASTIDVRTAKVGDEVILKATKSIKQDGEVVVQKGARLIGRITEVQQKTKENAVSKLQLVFERIEGDGLNAPISASIVSIVDTRASGTLGEMANTDVAGTSQTSTSVSRGSSGGGGLLGGVGSAVGGVLNTASQTTGSAVGAVSSTAGGAAETVIGTVGGIRISQSAQGSANSSTTLSSGEKNIRLEKGVTFNLLINASVEN
ncbi:MAG: hypothetical protein C4325_06195 [Blastocatellia bacterium]